MLSQGTHRSKELRSTGQQIAEWDQVKTFHLKLYLIWSLLPPSFGFAQTSHHHLSLVLLQKPPDCHPHILLHVQFSPERRSMTLLKVTPNVFPFFLGLRPKLNKPPRPRLSLQPHCLHLPFLHLHCSHTGLVQVLGCPILLPDLITVPFSWNILPHLSFHIHKEASFRLQLTCCFLKISFLPVRSSRCPVKDPYSILTLYFIGLISVYIYWFL